MDDTHRDNMAGHSAPASPGQQRREILRVLWVVLELNWAVAAMKLLVGMMSGSLTVLADGFHSLLDGANNIIGIVAVRLGGQPPDANHPYGHQKFENAAAMAIGGLVMLLCWEVLESAWQALMRLVHEPPAEAPAAAIEPLWLLLMLTTLAINKVVATWEHRAGVRLGSPVLKADATHTNSDILVTCFSLVSLLLSPLLPWLDPILALAVVGFLMRAGWSILGETINAITDHVRLDPQHVRDIAEQVPGVLNCHSIRSHGAENDIHLDLHILVGEECTAREAEEIEHRVRACLYREFPAISFVGIKHQTSQKQADKPLWQ